MLEIPDDPECVFSFWVGMPYSTQLRILQISSDCPTIKTIAVFRDSKWPTPVAGTFVHTSRLYIFMISPFNYYSETIFPAVLGKLNELGCAESGKWDFVDSVNTAMFGSGERKTAWVFSR